MLETNSTPPPAGLRRPPTPYAQPTQSLRSRGSISCFLSKLRRTSKTPSSNETETETEFQNEQSYFSTDSSHASDSESARRRTGNENVFPGSRGSMRSTGHENMSKRSSMKPSTSIKSLRPNHGMNEKSSSSSSSSASASKTKVVKDKDGSKGAAASALPNFELTPLSGLIKQSFADIEILKKQHALTEARGTGEGKDGPAPALTDFKKVEENLRKFEDLYRQHLRYGGAYGETGEEVHLVAMVCKRSDVVRGGVKNGRGVPVKEVRRVPDCGL